MVARFSEMPVPWPAEAAVAPSGTSTVAGSAPAGLALRGQLLLERASTLADVSAGGRGIPGFDGLPLHIAGYACQNHSDSFIRDRIFAVIGGDGSMCLRLPGEIADDLVDNGLCIPAGKNLLTWPVENAYQLEVSWRILLHAYWNVTSLSTKHARRTWSEFVIQH